MERVDVLARRSSSRICKVCNIHLKFKDIDLDFQNFYMIGRDKSRATWRVLKIDRTDYSKFNILEDPTIYSEEECQNLLHTLHEGNKSNGGLIFITNCYGIVGFIKFLGPYYMILITQREKIGNICGHPIYAVSKTEMIALPNSTVQSNLDFSKKDDRYKKLLCRVDLTKDFFFSYSYNIMHSLQENLSNKEKEEALYETMFVWNEFLTHEIRNLLKNTLWTVALVYGFFEQTTLSISGKGLKLTLIARRSRHYAGTRYLKRGVNEEGKVANDVEIEQMISEDVTDGISAKITSVVQNRGSIPLCWSQETSYLKIKPDIILKKKKDNFEATRLHFDNLNNRYGNPIIILNLIKACEKQPRESILRSEFGNVIEQINRGLTHDDRLLFVHLDLSSHFRRNKNPLALLAYVATCSLKKTGFLYCHVMSTTRFNDGVKCSFEKDGARSCSLGNHDSSETNTIDAEWLNTNIFLDQNISVNPIKIQKGVLRTNCVDCIDRTNEAQYAYGLAALGYQLNAMGVLGTPKISPDDPLGRVLMRNYESVGNTLALQYGGSAAYNKIFNNRRGQWKAATRSQELFRTIQRFYNNVYLDAEKQDSINVFLGYFRPQQGQPALWELNSREQYNRWTCAFALEEGFFQRSLSVGNVIWEGSEPLFDPNAEKKILHHLYSREHIKMKQTKDYPIPLLKFQFAETDITCYRYNTLMALKQIFKKYGSRSDEIHLSEIMLNDGSNCSNFLNWIPSSGNSFGVENWASSSVNDYMSENVAHEITLETMTTTTNGNGTCMKRGESTKIDSVCEDESTNVWYHE